MCMDRGGTGPQPTNRREPETDLPKRFLIVFHSTESATAHFPFHLPYQFELVVTCYL